MTVQAITKNETKNFTRLQKFWLRLRALDDAFNYDPQEHLYESHKRLTQQVERLQARVQDLERREKQDK